MTGIKPTVSLFSVWQRELDKVPVRFAILYIQLLLWLYILSSIVLMSTSWPFCHMLWPWPLWLCDLSHDIFPCSTLVIKEKKRKEKEILNNDLAILPSHDNALKQLLRLVDKYISEFRVFATWVELTDISQFIYLF